MRKGPGSVYDKWNISVVLCDRDVFYHLFTDDELEESAGIGY
jgi:hypothetical protein